MSFLLLPGTGGANFSTASGDRASFVLEIIHGSFRGWTEKLVRELSCEHASESDPPWAPIRTSLASPDARLTPREVLLATAYPVVDAAKYTPFPYDWRLDIRHNGRLLLEHLAAQNTPVNILTHSQGGLVVIAASLLCDSTEEWHDMVGSVCMVAPPLMGTVNGMDAIVNGANFGNLNSDFFRAASRTWPALFQMFPQWACVSNHPAKRSTSESLWPTEPPAVLSLLNRAKDYFALVDYAPFRHFRRERLMIVLGNSPKPNTAVSVNATADGPVVQPERVTGDSLVPYDITFKFLDDLGLRNRVMTVRGAHQPGHFRLLGDARIYDDCDRFLSL